MQQNIPTREQAYDLLSNYNKNNSLIIHSLAVEAVMLHFAYILGELDKEKWGIIGLVHDVDYEMYPEQHCIKAREIVTRQPFCI